jgi:hypothetical protein
VADRSVRTDQISCIQRFDLVLPNLTIESIHKPADPNRLQLHTFNGHKFATVSTVTHRGRTYAPASIATGLAQAIRFPRASQSFGSAQKLTTSMLEFLTRYAHLLPDAAALLVAFALASWFPNCIPVVPVLYLLGPANETRLVLRLLRSICRRAVLLGNVDVAAIATLPKGLNPTLLIGQRKLAPNVQKCLLTSNSRYFRIARGTGELHIHGAKAFSIDHEPESDFGIRISLSPAGPTTSTVRRR